MRKSKKLIVLFACDRSAKSLEIDDPEEKKCSLENMELKESGMNKLDFKLRISLLHLITYFTAGPQEVRAWTIKKGWKAPQRSSV